MLSLISGMKLQPSNSVNTVSGCSHEQDSLQDKCGWFVVEGADAALVRHLLVIASIKNTSAKSFFKMPILHSIGFKPLRW